jgi:RNA polymerase sigma-70 factor (ECF subfamily)
MDFSSEDRCLWLANQIVPHEPALRDWLGRLTGLGADQIDDLVQETYAILATRADVSSIHNPRAYAFQVARSILLQQVRRARIVTIGALADLEHLEEAADQPSPEQHAIARDEYSRVACAIAEMPTQTRRAFQLRRVDGLSQREIASQLGLSENTVEKHIMRGIKMLMQQFGRGGKAPSDASTQEQRGPSLHHDRPRARAKY